MLIVTLVVWRVRRRWLRKARGFWKRISGGRLSACAARKKGDEGAWHRGQQRVERWKGACRSVWVDSLKRERRDGNEDGDSKSRQWAGREQRKTGNKTGGPGNMRGGRGKSRTRTAGPPRWRVKRCWLFWIGAALGGSVEVQRGCRMWVQPKAGTRGSRFGEAHKGSCGAESSWAVAVSCEEKGTGAGGHGVGWLIAGGLRQAPSKGGNEKEEEAGDVTLVGQGNGSTRALEGGRRRISDIRKEVK